MDLYNHVVALIYRKALSMFFKTTKANRTFLFLFLFLALSSFSPCASAGTTVYPPENMEAGNGLLYFPKGGESSVYAVPVQSKDLVDAIKELKEVLTKTSAWQCNWYGGPTGAGHFYGCVNTVTGLACHQESESASSNFDCPPH